MWTAASKSSPSRKEGKVTGAVHHAFAARPMRRAADRKSPPASRCRGMARRLYVALNLSNRLAELDAATGKVLRLWDVGVAPYDVVLAGHKAYVSNWGGRRPDAQSVTGPAGRGTLVRVDPVRYIASEGSVSSSTSSQGGRCRPRSPQLRSREILTGLHASAMALSPNGRWLVVANAGSDTLSVIDTRSDAVVETIWARQNPGRPLRRPAQRPGLRHIRQAGFSSATAPRTPSPSLTSPPANRGCWA